MVWTTGKRFIAGEWEHIFRGERAPREVRLVFDRQADMITRCLVAEPHGGRWRAASGAEISDIEDSLRNGNPELLEEPADYGLDECAPDELPAWTGVMPGRPINL